MKLEYSILRNIPLFEGISANELERIFMGMNVSVIHFHKGDVIARTDEPCNRLITLLSGVVKGEISDPSGKVIKIEDISAPYSVSSLFVFSRKNFPVQVTAEGEVTTLIIPTNALFQMLIRSEILLKNFLYLSTIFAYRLVHRLHVMAFLTIRKKIAMYLLELYLLQKSDTVKVGMTHAAWAEYFGVSRQALERELKNMESEGLLSVDRRNVTLCQKGKLEHMVRF